MKVTEAVYNSAHLWLKENYGKADCCENKDCEKLKSKFQWALIAGKDHSKDRSSYQKLCTRCHAQYDSRYKNKGKKIGNMNIRVTEDAHKALQIRARKNKRTLQAELELLLETTK